MGHHQAEQYTHYWHHRRKARKELRTENVLKEITAENFPNRGKKMNILIQEAQRS